MVGQGNISFVPGPTPGIFSIFVYSQAGGFASGVTRSFANVLANLSALDARMQIPVTLNCTITGAYIQGAFNTIGSAEAWSMFIRVNNSINHLISTQSVATNVRRWINNGLAIDLNAGDSFSIVMVMPVFSVTPTLAWGFAGNVFFRLR